MAFWNRKRTEAGHAAAGHRVLVLPAGKDSTGDPVWMVELAGHFTHKTAAVLVGRAIASLLDLEYQEHGESGRIQRKDSSGEAPDDPKVPG